MSYGTERLLFKILYFVRLRAYYLQKKDFMDIIQIILTSILSISSLFIIAKCMGHKQVSQLDFFDYISGITIGSIAAEMATDLESPWKSLLALAIYGLVSITLNKLTAKFPRTRKYINGTPAILLNKGKLYRENLKKAKLDLSEFLMLCREQGYFDLRQISCAIFEYNGRLSILPCENTRPICPEDMNLKPDEAEFGIELIMDGRILGDNLNRANLDKDWLLQKIREKGYESADQILLATYFKGEDTLILFEN